MAMSRKNPNVSQQMAQLCANCQKPLPKRDRLTCSVCTRTYDLVCANKYDKLFYLMSKESKDKWTCHQCRKDTSTSKTTSDTSTPTRASRGIVNDLQLISDSDSDDSNVTIRRKGHTLYSSNDSIFLDSQQDPDENLKKNNEVLSEIILIELRSFRSQITFQLEQQEQRFTNLADKLETNIRDLFQKYATLKTDLDNLKVITDKTNIQTGNILKTSNSHSHQIDEANAKILTLERDVAVLKEHVSSLEDSLNHNASDTKLRPQENEKGRSNQMTNYTNTFNPLQRFNTTYTSQAENTKRLVLYGLNEYERESEPILVDQILRIFYDIYNIDLTGQIEEIRRIGRRGSRRPIVIELLSKRMTRHIIENATYFKNTGLFVSQFLDRDSLRNRKLLRDKLREARQSGQNALLRNNKLFVNGNEIHVLQAHSDTENRTQVPLSTSLDNQPQRGSITGEITHQSPGRTHLPSPPQQVKTFRP
jgi:hypothetical protein